MQTKSAWEFRARGDSKRHVTRLDRRRIEGRRPAPDLKENGNLRRKPWFSGESKRSVPSPAVRRETLFALIQNRLRCRGPHAADSQRPHGQEAIEGFHASRRLDLYVGRRTAPHQAQILVQCSSGAVTG